MIFRKLKTLRDLKMRNESIAWTQRCLVRIPASHQTHVIQGPNSKVANFLTTEKSRKCQFLMFVVVLWLRHSKGFKLSCIFKICETTKFEKEAEEAKPVFERIFGDFITFFNFRRIQKEHLNKNENIKWRNPKSWIHFRLGNWNLNSNSLYLMQFGMEPLIFDWKKKYYLAVNYDCHYGK